MSTTYEPQGLATKTIERYEQITKSSREETITELERVVYLFNDIIPHKDIVVDLVTTYIRNVLPAAMKFGGKTSIKVGWLLVQTMVNHYLDVNKELKETHILALCAAIQHYFYQGEY